MLRLEDRISALEKNLSASVVDSPQKVDAALCYLGEKIKDTQPQYSYFNIRFRATEAVLANVKALGNELGERHRKTRLNGSKVKPPGSQSMKSKLCTQADIESDWAASGRRE